jgi:hypothetical protein
MKYPLMGKAGAGVVKGAASAGVRNAARRVMIATTNKDAL